MTELALALAAGAALSSAGVVWIPAALLVLALTIGPIASGWRPSAAGAGRHPARRAGAADRRSFWIWAALAGLTHGAVDGARALRDCRWTLPDGPVDRVGWVRTVESPTRFQLQMVEGACRRTVRVQGALPEDVAEGGGLRVRGRWVRRARPSPGLDPLRAGIVVGPSIDPMPLGTRGLDRMAAAARARGVEAVRARFTREAPFVNALLFARRDGITPEVRDAFTSTGTAHLLAISGFHVGVLAAGVVGLVGRFAPPRRAFAAGSVLAWAYVGVLGFPDAATRAALLLTLASLGRIVGRPVVVSGAVGTALAVLVLFDPSVAGRIGAQLSFAGALGLAVLTRPWTEAVLAGWRGRWGGAPGPRVRAVLEAVVATVAATLTTLPFVAWHFERVSLVGLPASLGATPLVALALPAIVVALGLDVVGVPGAAVAAAGAEGLIGVARGWITLWARVPWASVAIARPEAVAAVIGAMFARVLVGRLPRVGALAKGGVAAAGVAAGLLAWPVSQQVLRNGALEVHVFDVGQGDALGIRTPAGRWLLIDAGPPTGRRLVADLRRVGVREIEMFVISHPDADHVGGAATVLESLPTRAVVGPGTLRGGGPWRDALERARRRGIPWRLLARGGRFAIDGVAVDVLHPVAEGPEVGGVARDANEASLVMEVRWRGVRLLFTGDISVETEEELLPALGPVDVLKVAHHGSRTSTGAAFVERVRPEIAIVSVGQGNRYGHPAPDVLDRLDVAGVSVWRTDRHGAIRLRVDRTGRLSVEASDPQGR